MCVCEYICRWYIKKMNSSPLSYFMSLMASTQFSFLIFFFFLTETKTRKVKHGAMLSLFCSRVTFQVLVCTRGRKNNNNNDGWSWSSAESCAKAKCLFDGLAVVPLPSFSCAVLFTLGHGSTLDLQLRLVALVQEGQRHCRIVLYIPE